MKYLSLIFALNLQLLCAGDYGVRGHLFPIQEEDLLDYLKSRLSNVSEEQLNSRYIKKAQQPASNPLSEAREYRAYYFDPSITADRTIEDHQGKVIVSKGARVNPLKVVSLSDELLFLDGSDERHVQWAKEQSPQARWILIKGQAIDLEEKEGRGVYFDQLGFLTTKLGIQHIPAKVVQENDKLKIQEIPL